MMKYKKKRFFKTTQNKEYKEITYFHYLKKKYYFEERCWRKLKEMSLKNKHPDNQVVNK